MIMAWINAFMSCGFLVFQIAMHHKRPSVAGKVLVSCQAVLTALIIALLIHKLQAPLPGVEG